MRISFWMLKGLPYLFAALSLCVTSPVSADSYAKNGFYIGVAKTKVSIGGDFDGQSYLTDGTEVILIPKINDGSGTSFQIGGRGGDTAFELNYLKSSHDATFSGATTKADFSMLSLDSRIFFMTNHPVQPYMLQGMIFTANLTVKDGSSNGSVVSDGRFRGLLGFNWGAGVSYYPIPSVSLNAGLVYRNMSFNQASGTGDWKSLQDNLSVKGRQLNFGLAYTF